MVNPGCTSPANLEPQVPARATCFACGEPVCLAPGCSIRRSWKKYGTRRICASCVDHDQRDGFHFVPQFPGRKHGQWFVEYEGERVGRIEKLDGRRWRFSATAKHRGRPVPVEYVGRGRNAVAEEGLLRVRRAQEFGSANPRPSPDDLARRRSAEGRSARHPLKLEPSLLRAVEDQAGTGGISAWIRGAVIRRLDDEGRPWQPATG